MKWLNKISHQANHKHTNQQQQVKLLNNVPQRLLSLCSGDLFEFLVMFYKSSNLKKNCLIRQLLIYSRVQKYKINMDSIAQNIFFKEFDEKCSY